MVVCGEGAMRNELEHMIRQHGLGRHVRLIGFQEDPNAWIAASDVFVHPTRSEGLSLVTIAAQMVSTPVVASEVGGLREVCDVVKLHGHWDGYMAEQEHLSWLIC